MENSPLQNLCSLQLTANLDDLEGIRHHIEACLANLKLDPSKTYDIDLAVTELVTNSLVHGYPEKSGWIGLEIGLAQQGLLVRIRDHAPEFDPTKILPPDLTLPLEKRTLGGMGIHLIRQIVLQMDYRRLPEGMNEITLLFSPGS